MEDLIRKTVLTAKKVAPNNWYEQRTIIGKVIEELANKNPKVFQKQEFADGRIVVLFFYVEGDFYFWWDGIRDGYVVECSGLERAITDPLNGKIKTEIMWSSDPDSDEPLIPQLPIYFK